MEWYIIVTGSLVLRFIMLLGIIWYGRSTPIECVIEDIKEDEKSFSTVTSLYMEVDLKTPGGYTIQIQGWKDCLLSDPKEKLQKGDCIAYYLYGKIVVTRKNNSPQETL